jgi:hypothetical protein
MSSLNVADVPIPRVDRARFSPAGWTAHGAAVVLFVRDLTDDSYRIAQRHRTDVVSASQVKTAAASLYARPKVARRKFAGVVGSAILGVAMSAAFLFLQGDTVTSTVAFGTAVSILAGGALVWWGVLAES